MPDTAAFEYWLCPFLWTLGEVTFLITPQFSCLCNAETYLEMCSIWTGVKDARVWHEALEGQGLLLLHWRLSASCPTPGMFLPSTQLVTHAQTPVVLEVAPPSPAPFSPSPNPVVITWTFLWLVPSPAPAPSPALSKPPASGAWVVPEPWDGVLTALWSSNQPSSTGVLEHFPKTFISSTLSLA